MIQLSSPPIQKEFQWKIGNEQVPALTQRRHMMVINQNLKNTKFRLIRTIRRIAINFSVSPKDVTALNNP